MLLVTTAGHETPTIPSRNITLKWKANQRTMFQCCSYLIYSGRNPSANILFVEQMSFFPVAEQMSIFPVGQVAVWYDSTYISIETNIQKVYPISYVRQGKLDGPK